MPPMFFVLFTRRASPHRRQIGIDLDPPDLGDPHDARWLLASGWPGTERLQRAVRAMEVGGSNRAASPSG